MSRLERLDLTSNAITDAGLPALHGLHHLRRLFLKSTKVTKAGVERLRGIAGSGDGLLS